MNMHIHYMLLHYLTAVASVINERGCLPLLAVKAHRFGAFTTAQACWVPPRCLDPSLLVRNPILGSAGSFG
jgi:hypothetical protein